MSKGKPIQHIDLTNPKYLQTLVENRQVFNMENCEMNVFESYQQAYLVPLTFNDFVITSMVRGKKVMHLLGDDPFDYLPGETVIVPANETMKIDFPEAQQHNPTQCIALAVDKGYIHNTLNYLNEYYNTREHEHAWKLQFNQYHFHNDNDVSDLINKLIRVCRSESVVKNIYADLNLKELLIRLVQSQYLQQISKDSQRNSNAGRLQFILDYIRNHISDKILVDDLSVKAHMNRSAFFKLFKDQFGITPVDYINRERVKLAKHLLSDSNLSVTEISWQSGFSDPNYFVRLFKKTEGITPGAYRDLSRKSA
ncbi:MAG: AraC family transcriptional regulator [Chitinophagaceae bacterium]|nr:AraC family transcriptional regulator [Chitinophagaceae bacterium]